MLNHIRRLMKEFPGEHCEIIVMTSAYMKPQPEMRIRVGDYHCAEIQPLFKPTGWDEDTHMERFVEESIFRLKEMMKGGDSSERF